MKKLLNPLIVSAFIIVLMLGSIAHLMYGSCQTTKYHYMVQSVYMPMYLPKIFLIHEIDSGMGIKVPSDYSGLWIVWFADGDKFLEGEYFNGIRHGKMDTWHGNGNREHSFLFNHGKLTYKEEWNEDGTLFKKEYYDPNGQFLKIERFEKGKLVRTETDE